MMPLSQEKRQTSSRRLLGYSYAYLSVYALVGPLGRRYIPLGR